MSLKILAIDDDPMITELLSFLLGSYGMEVITTNEGEQGVELARLQNPNLILLDLMMPGMDGWQVCQAIRSFSKVPIIAFSALGKSQEIARAMELGANMYLEKPIPGDVLVKTIKKLAALHS